MHASRIILASLLSLAQAGPLTKRQYLDVNAIQDAINAWQSDTGAVSNFLNTATSITDPSSFQQAAQSAHDSEVDELTHKTVLDQQLLMLPFNADLQNANNSLVTLGAFQFVVDELQDMVDQGPSSAAQAVSEINADRCVSVLPAIDEYFRAAANAIGATPVQAIRPTNCPSTPPQIFSSAVAVASPTPSFSPASY